MQGRFVPIDEMISGNLPSKSEGKNPEAAACDFRPIASRQDNFPSTTPPKVASFTPQIELKREGNRLTKIILKCPCGHTYTLNCVYTIPAG
ncbi:MAG: hypothetical protein ACP5MG_11230 [Verrucomicrobiia bacterium]|jgi:hypothetical protein